MPPRELNEQGEASPQTQRDPMGGRPWLFTVVVVLGGLLGDDLLSAVLDDDGLLVSALGAIAGVILVIAIVRMFDARHKRLR